MVRVRVEKELGVVNVGEPGSEDRMHGQGKGHGTLWLVVGGVLGEAVFDERREGEEGLLDDRVDGGGDGSWRGEREGEGLGKG